MSEISIYTIVGVIMFFFGMKLVLKRAKNALDETLEIPMPHWWLKRVVGLLSGGAGYLGLLLIFIACLLLIKAGQLIKAL